MVWKNHFYFVYLSSSCSISWSDAKFKALDAGAVVDVGGCFGATSAVVAVGLCEDTAT